MKIFNVPVRIYHARTFEYLGEVPEGQTIVSNRKGERILGWSLKHTFIILVILLGFGAFIGISMGKMAYENKQLKEEIARYDQITGLNMSVLNLEYLAGKYCTFKGKIPTNQDTIFKFVCESGAWWPEVTMAQLIIESQCFTSVVAKNAKNGFGMKKCGEGPKSRPNLQIPGVDWNGYGMYMNWYHSVLDRHLWDLWVFNTRQPNTIEEYLAKIGRIYAEDPDYINKVRKVAAKWKDKADAYRMEEAQKDTVQ